MSTSALSRPRLAAKAAIRFGGGVAVVAAVFFLPAGTLAYWEAWLYLAVLFVPILAVLGYLLAFDPALLDRRLRVKEEQPRQALIVKLGSVCYLVTLLLPGFDRRFEWSDVPLAAVLIADAVVLLGYGLFVLVLKENSYASRVVSVEAGQRVVTTGPYRIVRHPMYVAVLVMFFATPVALGSWWAIVPALPLAGVMAARAVDEERLLAAQLDGYTQYMQATRYRLIPGVW